MDYSKTVNLPQTAFPMKANLPTREPEIQALWDRLDIYHRVLEHRAAAPKYLLHDGPPYTSGPIHLGQALNKVLKDIVVKFKSMRGFQAPYVPGWDMHGLPTEMKALRTFKGLDRHAIPVMDLRRECYRTAMGFMEVQREQFKRLGVRGEWEHPYLTATPEYEQAVLGMFRDLVSRECIYRGLRPVYWCPTCETALAEAEIEYETATSASIYVRFRLPEPDPARLPGVTPGSEVYFLIWTTTPWTIPANVALAVHPMYEYAVVRTGHWGTLVVANELVSAAMEAVGEGEYEVLGTVAGQRLEGLRPRHPFLDRESPVVLADYVTLDQGTGIVHTAPGHGKEDYQTGLVYNLPVLSPVDGQGRFTDEAGKYAGMKVFDANPVIVADMTAAGSLLASGAIAHQYPHCWRCKGEVIFRATSQWFMAVDMFTEEALAAISGVQWIPSWGQERIENMVASRPDWCLSRQRSWGIGIPAFYCENCDEPLLTADSVEFVRRLVAEHGADVWYERPAADLLAPGAKCAKCGGTTFRKEQDVFDVWFDSASSHRAVMRGRPYLGWPADLYLEGSDQYRGWFQVSLWTAVAADGAAPYRTVLTHGFFLDETGRKMSKSLGNIVDPQDVVARYGADILRLWVSYVDFKADMPMSEDIFAQVTDAYRRIRNTVRFLLGNLYDFDPVADAVPREQMLEADRWAMHQLQTLIGRVTQAYEEFEFHRVYHALNTFCAVELSSFYLDILKDRLYTSAAKSLARRSAQTALCHLAVAMAKMVEPILTHTGEEIWQHLPGVKEESVQLADWPQVDQAWLDEPLAAKWGRLLILRGEVAKAIELARNAKLVNQSLAARVTLWAGAEDRALLEQVGADLVSILIVSQARLAAGEPVPEAAFQSADVPGLAVLVEPAEGAKCERCWMYSPTVGQDPEMTTLCVRCAATLRGETA